MEGNGQGTISVKLESHYDQQNYQHTVLSISYELLIMQVLLLMSWWQRAKVQSEWEEI